MVVFTYKNGRTRNMSEREAAVLEKLGHGAVSIQGETVLSEEVQQEDTKEKTKPKAVPKKRGKQKATK